MDWIASGPRGGRGCPPRWLHGIRVCGLLLIAVLLVVLPMPVRADFLEHIDYTLTDQNGADFSGQDLSGTSFAGAKGRRASFRDARLRGAILTQAAFADADFAAADLTDALMDRVDVHGADFTDALLRGVIASGSTFSGATVTNADFTDALLDREDQVALCKEAEGTNPVTGVNTRLSLGCG